MKKNSSMDVVKGLEKLLRLSSPLKPEPRGKCVLNKKEYILIKNAIEFLKLPPEISKQNEDELITRGTPVVATYGFNDVTKKPFKFLYEFGYYTIGGCVVYIKGERNMQDSYAMKLNRIKKATERDLKSILWGD